MSFSPEEIAEEFAAAAGLGRREWLDGDRYSVRGGDARRAANARWMKEWRRRNPRAARAADRRKYQRIKVDPARYALHLEQGAQRLRRYRTAPEVRRRQAAAALARYHRQVADPVRLAAIREGQRKAYLRRKRAAA